MVRHFFPGSSAEVFFVQNDDRRGMAGVVDAGQVKLGASIPVQVGCVQVVQVTAVPVLLEDAAVAGEEDHPARVIDGVGRRHKHRFPPAAIEGNDLETGYGIYGRERSAARPHMALVSVSPSHITACVITNQG